MFVYHLCLSCYIMLYHASRRTFFYYIKPRSQQIDWTSLRSFGAKKAIEWKNNFHGECELNHVRCRCTFLGIQTLQMNKCVIFFFNVSGVIMIQCNTPWRPFCYAYRALLKLFHIREHTRVATKRIGTATPCLCEMARQHRKWFSDRQTKYRPNGKTHLVDKLRCGWMCPEMIFRYEISCITF